MRDINLLPSEYQRKSLHRFFFPLLILVCLIAWTGWKYGFLLPAETRDQKAQYLSSLREETEKLPQLEESCQQQKAGLEELQNRVHAFQIMEEGTPQNWQDILNALINSLPSGVSIQEFACDNEVIKLSGICSNDVESANYLRNLQSSGFFPDVRMESIQYRSSREIQFRLSCSLPAYAAETEAAVP